MIKIYCDKCGEEIQELFEYTINVQAPEICSWDDQYLYIAKNYHLCKDCMKKFNTFVEGGK